MKLLFNKNRTYQEKTGTLSPGAHAGSYNGQDAYNDMLVVENEMELLERRADSGNVVGSECGGGSTNAG